jgi:enoyl-CoA hydratase/carnithine racemase
MNDRVRLGISDGIAEVRLMRADKMNALDPAMFEAIASAGEQLKSDPDVRVVVVSGEGRAFCAGLDVERITAATRGESILPFADLTSAPMASPISHSTSFGSGGGFQLALGADLRYAAPDTRFAVIETKWGLVPDMGGTILMRNLVRDDVVRELTYTARVFSAEEALGYGFITRIVADPRATALASARDIASRSPDAVRAAKRLLNLAMDCDAATGLAAETAEQGTLLGTPNNIEAVMANLENRSPQWSRA